MCGETMYNLHTTMMMLDEFHLVVDEETTHSSTHILTDNVLHQITLSNFVVFNYPHTCLAPDDQDRAHSIFI
jgi:hypothetical protein